MSFAFHQKRIVTALYLSYLLTQAPSQISQSTPRRQCRSSVPKRRYFAPSKPRETLPSTDLSSTPLSSAEPPRRTRSPSPPLPRFRPPHTLSLAHPHILLCVCVCVSLPLSYAHTWGPREALPVRTKHLCNNFSESLCRLDSSFLTLRQLLSRPYLSNCFKVSFKLFLKVLRYCRG